MESKKLLRQILILVVILAGITFLNTVFVQFLSNGFNQKGAALLVKNSEIVNGPVRLKIPSINVDAEVESVGLTSDGAMDVPKSPNNIGWFNQGSLPGEKGSAVMDGHYGWKNNIPAVFDNLHKLQKGDKIYSENKNGDLTVFVVTRLQVYDKDENVPDIFVSTDGKAHLNLITCTGAWNKNEKTFSNRLVVYAEKES